MQFSAVLYKTNVYQKRKKKEKIIQLLVCKMFANIHLQYYVCITVAYIGMFMIICVENINCK